MIVDVNDKSDKLMRVRFPKSLVLLLVGLFVAIGVMAQQTPKPVDYLSPYMVSLENPSRSFPTADGKPTSFTSLSDLTDKIRNGPPVEALNLAVNAVGPGDWHHLRTLRSLRLLTVFGPDTTALVLDSLLLNIADLPSLEVLRISVYNTTSQKRRSRREIDSTRQTAVLSVSRPLVGPIAGFVALRELHLSGDKIPAEQLIGRFSGNTSLRRVELWGGWVLPQRALPISLSRLPNLTELRVSGRGWQGWETAFKGLSTLRSLTLSTVSAGGPQPRSDGGTPVIKAYQNRHIADLNRGLAQLTGLQQLELSSVPQAERLLLGNLPALTHLRLHYVAPSDSMLMGMVTLKHLTLEEFYSPNLNLPTAVCDLSQLTDLTMVNEHSAGFADGPRIIIPACLSRLESLTALTIGNNPIRRLPLKAGDLPRLQRVQLTACQLDTFPAFITQLQSLRCLDVRGNAIPSIPDTIRAWRQLDTLLLDDNHLTKLPDFLPQLNRLRLLSIVGNNVSRLPENLGDLDSLRGLAIGNNALTTLPPSVGRLRRLQSLRIGKNQLVELPSWVGQLDQITELSCDFPLTVLLSSLVKMKQLESLFLRNTRLRAVPAWISSFRLLKHIQLESDDLQTLPASVGRLSNLETVGIRGRRFSRLPDSFGQLRRLTNLTVFGGTQDGNTPVTGTLTRLPLSLVNCKKLYAITLTEQPHLDVEILFALLAKLPALHYVDLTGDRIRALPTIEWVSLRWSALKLANNGLTRPPLKLAQIPDLQLLDLRNNPLPGSLNRSFHNHIMIQEALLPTSANR